MQQRCSIILVSVVALLLMCAVPLLQAQRLEDVVYKNPLTLQTAARLAVEHCADPTVIRAQVPSDRRWYLFCSSGPFGDAERDANGKLTNHMLPIFASLDLTTWVYVGDALRVRPVWAKADALLSAPEVRFLNGKYYLYYTVFDTLLPGGGSAIGVATSSFPVGPWADSGVPVVEPQPIAASSTARRWLSDAAVLLDDEQKYIYYGGSSGGVVARKLSADGLRSDPTTQVQLTIGHRYQGASMVKRDGFYYLFVSTPDCCRGPLTGANMFVGRAQSPFGPFVDQEGLSLMSARTGGTPVMSANGNRWVGPGHGAIIADAHGQDWLVYHAVDRLDPYFSSETGVTKRPVLLDQLDWIDGWPAVRGGRWASDTLVPAPAVQPDDPRARTEKPLVEEQPDTLLPPLSDEFSGAALSSQWAWTRAPISGASLISGTLRLETQAGNLSHDTNTAAVLAEPAPNDNYLVETRVRLNVPLEGCCANVVQAGLVIYGDDDNYIELTHAANAGTRQIEFANELAPMPPGYPRYGVILVGAPDEWTYLRIARQRVGSEDHYTASTSRNGINWVRGGTWTRTLGTNTRIGLVAMGGAGYTAAFDYVRVYQPRNPAPTATPTPTPLPPFDFAPAATGTLKQ